MPKTKSHKGLLKRIRITKSGKVKIRRVGGRHIKSKKTATRVRGYRRPQYATAADLKRLRAMLHRPLKSVESARAEAIEQLQESEEKSD
jgi:large subunit ribosomal protein L35